MNIEDDDPKIRRWSSKWKSGIEGCEKGHGAMPRGAVGLLLRHTGAGSQNCTRAVESPDLARPHPVRGPERDPKDLTQLPQQPAAISFVSRYRHLNKLQPQQAEIEDLRETVRFRCSPAARKESVERLK